MTVNISREIGFGVMAALLVALGGGLSRLHIHVSPAARYQEVKDWPRLPAGVQLGECAGVAVDGNGRVFIGSKCVAKQ